MASLTPKVALAILSVIFKGCSAFVTGVGVHGGELHVGFTLFRRNIVLSSPSATQMVMAPLGHV